MQEYRFFAGGKWQSNDRILEDYNPFSGEIFAQVPVVSQGQMEEAVRKAYMAFSTTSEQSTQARSRTLLNIGNKLVARRQDFLNVLVHESGKTFKEAKDELARTVALFRSASETAQTIKSAISPSDVNREGENSIAFVQRFPTGPVLGIASSAEPLLDPARKLAASLAAGNPVLICPAPDTPAPALLLAEICEESKVPEGSVSVLPASEDDLFWLAEHDSIRVILYSGPTDKGWKLKSRATKKKMLMEMSGLGVALVHKDADLEYAADCCVQAAFTHAGQLPTSLQRILVYEDVFHQFLGKVIKKTNQLTVGAPADPGTDVGPVVSELAAQQVEMWLKDAMDQGADLVSGGSREAALIQPTVFLETTGDMVISRKQVLGPVVSLQPFSDLDQALWVIHDIEYGLQTSLFTKDLSLAMKAYRFLEVGSVLVNQVPTFRAETLPYGGMKESGFGRSTIEETIKVMTEEKMLLIKNP